MSEQLVKTRSILKSDQAAARKIHSERRVAWSSLKIVSFE